MHSEKEAKRLVEAVLRLSKAEQTEVTISSTDAALTRFANNEIHQNVSERDVAVTVRAGIGKRYGIAGTNDLSEAGLESAVHQALETAKALPETEGWLPLPQPGEVARLNAHAITTLEFGPMQRAAGVRLICQKAREHGLSAAGAFRVDNLGLTIANSHGLFAHRVTTTAELLAVVSGSDSSGHSGRLAVNVDEIDPEAVADEAIGKAVQGRNPRRIEPGDYEVVLEHYAVSDILDFLGFVTFGALNVQEGRSAMSGRIGERIMGSNVSIADDPLNPSGVVRAFDYEGVGARRVGIIERGIAASPVYDRRTALKEERESTGHGLPQVYSTFGPMPTNLFMEPGDASHADLIGSVKRGILVTRFWYTRVVHPLTVHMTGMTRDGAFLIENGEIAAPVKNLRFTQSYIEALNQVAKIGRERRLVKEMLSFNMVPALKVNGWHFTGVTEY
ncbi:MAG: TldD/PmbA family protein [Chloroflexi bacterium]|nr:TldD/PmbA family protein [Chloroflexota bacterium]